MPCYFIGSLPQPGVVNSVNSHIPGKETEAEFPPKAARLKGNLSSNKKLCNLNYMLCW